MNTNQEMFLKWNTVQGIIFKDALENKNHITHLMAQDIRDKFGEECDLWVITKGEFEHKKKPRNTEGNRQYQINVPKPKFGNGIQSQGCC